MRSSTCAALLGVWDDDTFVVPRRGESPMEEDLERDERGTLSRFLFGDGLGGRIAEVLAIEVGSVGMMAISKDCGVSLVSGCRRAAGVSL